MEDRMRFVFALLAVIGLVVGSAAVPVAAAAAESGSTLTADDQQQPPSGRLEIDIDTDRRGGAWYTSPVWIAIGAVALVVLILLIVMATRGGGTTIVKE
jgi:hypothetical protein